MSKTEQEHHQSCLNRFIEVANQMKDEGVPPKVVSTAMMSASAVYATFVVTGNTGGLTESGVDKVTAAYKQHLQRVQEIRKAQDERLRAEAAKSS
jgi:hypothetical protein